MMVTISATLTTMPRLSVRIKLRIKMAGRTTSATSSQSNKWKRKKRKIQFQMMMMTGAASAGRHQVLKILQLKNRRSRMMSGVMHSRPSQKLAYKTRTSSVTLVKKMISLRRNSRYRYASSKSLWLFQLMKSTLVKHLIRHRKMVRTMVGRMTSMSQL